MFVTELTAPLTPEQLLGAPLPLPGAIAGAIPRSGVYPLLSLKAPEERHTVLVTVVRPAGCDGAAASASVSACVSPRDRAGASGSITDGLAVAGARLGVRAGDRLALTVAQDRAGGLVLCLQRMLSPPAGMGTPAPATADLLYREAPVITPVVAAALSLPVTPVSTPSAAAAAMPPPLLTTTAPAAAMAQLPPTLRAAPAVAAHLALHTNPEATAEGPDRRCAHRGVTHEDGARSQATRDNDAPVLARRAAAIAAGMAISRDAAGMAPERPGGAEEPVAADGNAAVKRKRHARADGDAIASSGAAGTVDSARWREAAMVAHLPTIIMVNLFCDLGCVIISHPQRST